MPFLYVTTQALTREQFNAASNGDVSVLLNALPGNTKIMVHEISAKDPKKRGDGQESTIDEAKELNLKFITYHGNHKADEYKYKMEWILKLIE